MSIETPEHWSGETSRYANVVMRLPSGREHYEGRVEEGLLAIAVELAELRKVLTPDTVTMVQPDWSPSFSAYIKSMDAEIAAAADAAGVPGTLLPQEHETSGFAHAVQSPNAVWQRRAMQADPSLCWVFTAPAMVCIAKRPCPRHAR